MSLLVANLNQHIANLAKQAIRAGIENADESKNDADDADNYFHR